MVRSHAQIFLISSSLPPMRPLYRGIASFGKNEATFIAKDSIMSDSFQPFRKAAGNHRLLCASQELQQIVALFSQDAPLILRGKLRKVMMPVSLPL